MPIRVGLAYTAIFSVSATILFGVLYWSVTREMTGALKNAVERESRELTQAFAHGQTQRLLQAIQERRQAASPGELAVLVLAADGEVLEGNLAKIAPFSGWRELGAQALTLTDDDEADDEVDGVLALGVNLDGAFLLVGRSLHPLRETQELLLRSLAWTLGVTFILALAGGFAMGRGASRQIESINRTTLSIMDGDLAQRIPAAGRGDELDRLAGNINRMLDRNQELMVGLQQVSNDIAHDLRTPLGRLRQRLDSARRQEVTVEGYKSVLNQAICETDTILDTFNALLRIGQIEAGARKAKFSDVDLSDIANTIAEAYQTVADDSGQEFGAEIAIGSGVHVRGDRDLLTQMLANVVENAIRHCPTQTSITMTLAPSEQGPLLAVSDDGPGIPAEERDKVIRRFYRIEKSRTTPGSGLGLALAKAISDLHGASMRLVDNKPGLRVEIQFGAARGP